VDDAGAACFAGREPGASQGPALDPRQIDVEAGYNLHRVIKPQDR
jgi:hypothetical protein